MKKIMNSMAVYCAILVVLIVVLVMALINSEKLTYEESSKPESTPVAAELNTEPPTEEETTPEDVISHVSIIAVGDNLISDSVTHCGLESDGSYNFAELFEMLKSDIEAADMAIINQETILGGPDFAYSGYPNFNNPYEIGDAIIDAGFDVVLHATNHTYDMGLKGIENCMAYWEQHPQITVLGMNKTPEAQNEIPLVEKNGITFAILNYTYSLNGYILPDGSEHMVNLIDEDKIRSDIERAEELADFTIVCPHWGVEYTHQPIGEQWDLAEMMAEAGADLIIGTHPHVLESIDWVEGENGNKALCYFSLGNYTSSQDKVSTMLGGMAKLTITKHNDEVYIEEGAGIVPIVTHYIWGTGRLTKTYKLTEYTEELAAQHSIHSVASGFTVDKLNEIAQEVVGDWIVE